MTMPKRSRFWLLASVGLLFAVLVLAITNFFKPMWGTIPVADDQFVQFAIVRDRVMILVQSVSNPKAALEHQERFGRSMGRVMSSESAPPYFSFNWRKSYRLILQPYSTKDWDKAPTMYTLSLTQVIFPLWVPALGLLIYPVVLLVRGPLRRRRRRARGQCLCCGYNLTGNVSGKCSECGEPCEPDERAT